MKKRYTWKLLTALFFLFGLCLIPAKAVSASNPTEVALDPNTTYTTYDITGDWRPDTIRIKTDSRKYDRSELTVIINDKKTFRFKKQHYYDVTAKIYTLSNGKPYLYLYASADNYDGPVCGVFKYSAGKLKQVINFQDLMKNYGAHPYGEVLAVNGKQLQTRFYLMSWSTGPSYIDFTYRYNNGNLKRTGYNGQYHAIYSYGQDTRTFTANQKLKAYRKPGAAKKAFTIQKGTPVIIQKCWVKGRKMYIQVTARGKTGWIKAMDTSPRKAKDKQFKNVTYAG